jgi:glycosyltransferase involved in cell wall biosynthesis
MARVSIVMATYNGEAFLAEQLESLAAQTCRPAELVVCDDGSEDATLAIVRGFATRAPFPVLLHENSKRLGYRANFMRAAALGSSELIAFCDQDDIWAAGKIETMLAAFEDPAVLLAFHNATIIDRNRNQIACLYEAQSRIFTPLSVHPWRVVLGFTQMFRRSLIAFSELQSASIDPTQSGEPLAHDQFYFFLGSVLGSIAYLPESLVCYRQHDKNAFGWEGPQSLSMHLRAIVTAEPRARLFAAAARNRLHLLEEIKSSLPALEQARVDYAIDYYSILYRKYNDRCNFYKSNSYFLRLGKMANLLFSKTYNHHWASALGLADLLMDFCFGLPLGPRLKNLSSLFAETH